MWIGNLAVLEDERVGGGEWRCWAWIDIYRVDCVNAGAQKDPIDFRRCVNGNTIDGDTSFCIPRTELWLLGALAAVIRCASCGAYWV